MAIRHNALRFGLLVLAAISPLAHGAEHVTLKNGFELDCVRRETVGDKVRFYFAPAHDATGTDYMGTDYMEVAGDAVLRIETVPDAPEVTAASTSSTAEQDLAAPTGEEMHAMLAHAGAAHHIDEDLLASVVRAESGGRTRAVSRTGAQGLMQLMPETAKTLGVADAFRPDQNISGGTAYLDALLTRYHDNATLALAAYNAGPGAVDKFHGVPPYRETREYVSRVIREFNRRKRMLLLTAQAK